MICSGHDVYRGVKKKKVVEKREPQYSKELVKMPVIAPLNGNILDIKVKPGDSIEVGDPLLVMSAMKLETEIPSEVRGKVLSIKCAVGEQVSSDQVLVETEGYEMLEEEDELIHSASSAAGHSGGASSSLANQSLSVWYNTKKNVRNRS